MPVTYHSGFRAEQIKPGRGCRVDWSHPLAWGLKGCWLHNTGGNYDTNLSQIFQPLFVPNVSLGPSRHGQAGLTLQSAVAYAVNSTEAFDFGDGTADVKFTIAFWMRRTGAGNAQTIMGKYWDLDGIRGWEIGLDSPLNCLVGTDVIYVTLFDESIDGYIGVYGPAPILNDWAFIVVSYDGSQTVNGLKIYKNGIRIDNTTYDSGTYVAMEPTNLDLVFGNRTGEGSHYDGMLDCTYVWKERELNQAEVEWLSVTPFEFFITASNLNFYSNSGNTPGIVQLRGLGSHRSEATVQARPETRYMGTPLIVQARGLGTERAEGTVQARAEQSQRAEAVVQARNLERVSAPAVVQARINSMQRAQATVQARFLETIRAQTYAVLRSRGEQRVREGYEVWVDGAFAGFIDATASPLELTGVAMALGTHEVEIRPSRHFWTPRSPEWVWRGTVDAGGNLVAEVPDEIQNLRYTILFSTGTDNVQLDWFYETRFGCIDPTEFAIWTGPASPVDVSGAAVETVTYMGDGAYWAFIDLTVTTWVAVRARTATANGPVSEIQVVFPSAPTSPPNQWAEPPPPNYPIQP